MGAMIKLTPSGYEVAMFHEKTNRYLEDVLDIQFELNHRDELIVHSSVLLGKANRDRFPTALNLNQSLTAGFIGLNEEQNRVFENFVLVDRRNYSTLSVKNYFCLLKQLLNEAIRIREEKLLD